MSTQHRFRERTISHCKYLSLRTLDDFYVSSIVSTIVSDDYKINYVEAEPHRINDNAALVITRVIQPKSHIISLIFKYNYISDNGAAAIARLLLVNSTLKLIDLSNNKIHDLGISFIAEAIVADQSLSTLKLSNNPFSDAGLMSLAQSLNYNTNLKSIFLDDLKIKGPGLLALYKSLHFNWSNRFISVKPSFGCLNINSSPELYQSIRLSNFESFICSLQTCYFRSLSYSIQDSNYNLAYYNN